MGTNRGTLGLPTVINRRSIGYPAGTQRVLSKGKAHPKAVKPIVSSVANFSVENMFTASPVAACLAWRRSTSARATALMSGTCRYG